MSAMLRIRHIVAAILSAAVLHAYDEPSALAVCAFSPHVGTLALTSIEHPDTWALSGQQPETAEWVARQVDARDIGKDGRFQMKMRLFDRQQRARERELTIVTLRGQAKGTRNGASGAGDRVLSIA